MKKETKEFLELIKAHNNSSKLHPYRWFIPIYGDMNIYEYTDPIDILKNIWDKGCENGQESGKFLKIQEIKKVLNINDDEI